jgi:hypothetical protein
MARAMTKNGTLGHIGGALLLDARATREREIPKLGRFFAQFADDRLGGKYHSLAAVADGVHLLVVGPHDSAVAASVGADLARCTTRLGFGTLRWRLFHLPSERADLMAQIEAHRAAPTHEKASPIDGIVKIETALGGTDASEFLRERSVYALDPAGDKVAFTDTEVMLDAVGDLAGVEIAGNSWLVERASTLVERRMLRHIAAATRARERPICLHFHSRFADDDFFRTLIDQLASIAKERLILDFSTLDAHENPDRLSAIMARLQDAGIAVALSQIEWAAIDAIAVHAAKAAWLKGRFDPAVPASHALLTLGASRCVATDLATPALAEAAAQMGFVNVAGVGADAFAAQRRSRLLRAQPETRAPAKAETGRKK